MATDVFFYSLGNAVGNELIPFDLRPGLADLVARLGLTGVAGPKSRWGLKVQLGAQGLPPAVDPVWARAVADLLDNPGKAVAMGRQGRRRVEARFTLSQMITQIEALYDRTIAQSTEFQQR